MEAFLQTLKNWVRYSSDIWNTLLWDTTKNNYCWLGVCDNHQKKIQPCAKEAFGRDDILRAVGECIGWQK